MIWKLPICSVIPVGTAASSNPLSINTVRPWGPPIHRAAIRSAVRKTTVSKTNQTTRKR